MAFLGLKRGTSAINRFRTGPQQKGNILRTDFYGYYRLGLLLLSQTRAPYAQVRLPSSNTGLQTSNQRRHFSRRPSFSQRNLGQTTGANTATTTAAVPVSSRKEMPVVRLKEPYLVSQTSEFAENMANRSESSSLLFNGHPWVYNTYVGNFSEISNLKTGTFVKVQTQDGFLVGIGILNRNSSIAVRMVKIEAPPQLDGNAGSRGRNKLQQSSGNASLFSSALVLQLIADRIQQAVQARSLQIRRSTSCRLINGEADLLPGLFVDFFGKAVTIRYDALAMQALDEMIHDEVSNLLHPDILCVHRLNRKKEKLSLSLDDHVSVFLKGDPAEDRIEVRDEGFRVAVSLSNWCQEGGWLIQDRYLRGLVGSLAKGQSVLDIFCRFGEFGVQCAIQGAREVLLLESNDRFKDLAEQTVILNRLEDICSVIHTRDVLQELQKMAVSKLKFGIALVRCPIYMERSSQQRNGQFGERRKPSLKGHELLIKRAVQLLKPEGYLCVSVFVSGEDSHTALNLIRSGIELAGKRGNLVYQSGPTVESSVLTVHSECWHMRHFCVCVD